MGKVYSEVFKKRAITLLFELNEKKSVKVDRKTITNVRDLVKALGISKDSIYLWRKKFTPEKQPEKPETKKKRKGTIRREKFEKQQAELSKQKEARLKIKDLEKDLSRLKQITLSEDPEIKKKIREKVKEITKIEKKESIIPEKEFERKIEEELPPVSGAMDIFGGRFVGSIAQAMSIPNYSRLKLKQLLLKVGQRYIEKSGLNRKEGK
jgi:hypothetical protein